MSAVVVPTWDAVSDKRDNGGELTALERFVHANEPAGKHDELLFRAGLMAVLAEAEAAALHEARANWTPPAPEIFAYDSKNKPESYAAYTIAQLHAAHAAGLGQAAVAETALRKVLDVVNRYLPPDGISKNAALSEIIAVVDPWPLCAEAGAGGALRERLETIEVKAQAGLCYFTLGSAREFLKDIRDEVADALGNARPAR